MAEIRRGVHPPVISAELSAELKQYRGKWTAIDQGRLIAVGDTLREVIARAAEQGIDDPLTFHVPAHWGERLFFGAAT